MHNSSCKCSKCKPSSGGIKTSIITSETSLNEIKVSNPVFSNANTDVETLQVQNNVSINDDNSERQETYTVIKTENVKSSDEIDHNIRTYRTRIWILGIFAYLAFFQTVVWGTFGPIMTSAEYVFGWNDDIIAILQSLGPIGIVVSTVPMSWFTQTYGPRKAMLCASFFMMLGTGIRCITSSNTAFTVLAILGGFLNGVAGSIALGLPPMISALWFPPQERTTATAIGALAAQMGGAGMYLSPLIVGTPPPSTNSSSLKNTDKDASQDNIKADIMELMYIEFGIALFLFLCILIYFPDRPKNPPSTSSKIERVKYFSSIKTLSRNTEYIIVMATYMFSFGVPVVWISVMNFSLQCIDIDQDQVMWIGIAACFACALTSVIVARVTDILYGYMKITIICLLILSSLFFLWYLLLVDEVITPSLGQVYVAIVGGYALEYATVPLLIELGVELAYPCSETVVGASFTGGFSFVAMIFLFLFIIPTECYYWAGYVLVACTLVPTIPLYFVKEKHKRSTIDGK